MKNSRRNLANQTSRAEKRLGGPLKVSKYAAKLGRGEAEKPKASPGISTHAIRDA